MMKKETRYKYLKKLASNNMGKALKEELEEQKADLLDVRKAENWEDALGRQHAVKLIDKLMAVLSILQAQSDNSSRNEYL